MTYISIRTCGIKKKGKTYLEIYINKLINIHILFHIHIFKDKKYDNLKSSYFNLTKYTKELKDKYIKLKEERAKDPKKQIYGMHNSTLHSLSDASTPTNSDIHRIANARYKVHYEWK